MATETVNANASTEQNIVQAEAKMRSLHRSWQAMLLVKREPLSDGMEVAQYVPVGPLYASAPDAMGHAAKVMNERADVIGVTAHAVFTTTRLEG